MVRMPEAKMYMTLGLALASAACACNLLEQITSLAGSFNIG